MDQLKRRLKELELLIEDAKARVPAHSVKPPVMMQLFEYEDEYAEIQKKIREKLQR